MVTFITTICGMWTGNEEPDMDHYNIYRDGIKVGEVDESQTTFTDSGLEPETTYSYRVSAVDDEGNEGPLSDPDSATTQAEPVDTSYDGTFDGLSESLSPTPESNILIDAIDSLAEQVSSWWVGWWPRLHVMLDFMTPNGGTATLHFSVDLLFDLDFEDSSFDTPVDDQMTQMQKTEWANNVKHALSASDPLYQLMVDSTALIAFGLGVVSALLVAPPLFAGYQAAIMLGYLIIWHLWLVTLVYALFLGIIGPDFMTGILTAFLQSVIGGYLIIIAAATTYEILARKINGATDWQGWSITKLKWGFIGLLFFLFIIGATFYVWAIANEWSMQLFMGEI
jgi:hypothetical protein